MKIVSLAILVVIGVLSGCDSSKPKARKTEHLGTLNCSSSRQGRTTEELQAIGDACFRGGSYSKSSGSKW